MLSDPNGWEISIYKLKRAVSTWEFGKTHKPLQFLKSEAIIARPANTQASFAKLTV